MLCNDGKTDGETKKSDRKYLFLQKCFWSEPKTFASPSGVLFVKKHEGNKWQNTKNLIKNLNFLVCFSRFAQALRTSFKRYEVSMSKGDMYLIFKIKQKVSNELSSISRSYIQSAGRISISKSNIWSADWIAISRSNIRSGDRITISRWKIQSVDWNSTSRSNSINSFDAFLENMKNEKIFED